MRVQRQRSEDREELILQLWGRTLPAADIQVSALDASSRPDFDEKGSNRHLVRAQRGDREAFRALFQALYPSVSGYVCRRVRRPADADDVVGQVFFRLVEGLAHVDPKKGSVRVYALVAARHALVDHARGRGVQASEDEAVAIVDRAVQVQVRQVYHRGGGDELQVEVWGAAALPRIATCARA